ncbi:MAG: hypothetical protein KJ056_00255 [Acidimicrobiia bacterium]|nr:hypothetical protein [Acidimicrobiia bacterium]
MIFTHRWQHCDDNVVGINCVNIGTDTDSYTLTPAEVGKYVKVLVTATNVANSDVRWSMFSAQVGAALPCTAWPAVSGTTIEGGTLVADGGVWTSTEPVTLVYTWQRCLGAEGTGCTDVGMGTAYPLGVDDIGSYLRVSVVAWNDGGDSAAAVSGTTGPIYPAP